MRVEPVVRERAELGEGPTWDPDGERLIWVDILGGRIHGYRPGDGRRSVRVVEQHVGAAKPRAGGGLVLNLRDGVFALDDGPDAGRLRPLHHDPVPGRRGNDAAVAPDGSLWAGTMRYDEGEGGGTLVRVAPDGSSRTILSDVTVSNGLGWSPEGDRMYYIDTPTRRVDVFAFTPEGEVRDRRPLVHTGERDGFPDGMTVDADGCLWVAFWEGGAVRRYTPDGRLDRTLRMPVSRPTACAFGGPDLRDLYITCARVGLGPHEEPLAGSLLVVPDAGRGLPQPAFAG
ncbi:SMP-30/gluconolactonase/LRE family protein [Streptomyces calidiresistens]|uniref:SMP-30/gluconolactonase/LRE family protein n=1 Tax=Streptomyces calidiresistens TaxID=1485586 RepID=A0A7W3XY45_9ACTN|nr:SMP-30/gluconolactonase/LRE family protein [Streptomyces calidiresistens]MBB0231441.1 SMP-30/gluconolactonase/LRE family protein [Streptomyces calidiresistens]